MPLAIPPPPVSSMYFSILLTSLSCGIVKILEPQSSPNQTVCIQRFGALMFALAGYISLPSEHGHTVHRILRGRVLLRNLPPCLYYPCPTTQDCLGGGHEVLDCSSWNWRYFAISYRVLSEPKYWWWGTAGLLDMPRTIQASCVSLLTVCYPAHLWMPRNSEKRKFSPQRRVILKNNPTQTNVNPNFLKSRSFKVS